MNKIINSTLIAFAALTINAYADTDTAGQTGGLIATIGSFLPLIIVFAIFYFLVIKPQQKKQEAHAEKVAGISAGDEVVTAGGIVAKVKKAAASDNFAEVEIADGVIVKVAKHTIAEVSPKAEKPKKSAKLKETFGSKPKIKNTKKASSK